MHFEFCRAAIRGNLTIVESSENLTVLNLGAHIGVERSNDTGAQGDQINLLLDHDWTGGDNGAGPGGCRRGRPWKFDGDRP